MRHRGAVILIGLTASVAATFGYHSDFLRRFRARHVGETEFVSAGNRQLRGLFVGMPADARWNPAQALRAAKEERRCSANHRSGLFGKLVALIERTVYAQGTCNAYSCSGSNWAQNLTNGQCNDPGVCYGNFSQIEYDQTTGQCGGFEQTGTNGCSGPGCGTGS